MSKPKAVLISDVHYSLSTLELADKAFRMAIDKASELKVPLIDCGDLTNDKALLRAEVVNRLIDTMNYAGDCRVPISLLVGNHSLVNEKGKEHALEFLRPYVEIIDDPGYSSHHDLNFIPYQNSLTEFQNILFHTLKLHRPIIMHQGMDLANPGHYVHDKNATKLDWFKGLRIISGHYHARQHFKTDWYCVDYVGNPYTLTFGEANDPPKGFQILMDDGTLQFVPTNLRKHVVEELTVDAGGFLPPLPVDKVNTGDLLWLKIKGPKSILDKYSKQALGDRCRVGSNYKLDLIPTDSPEPQKRDDKLTDLEVLYSMIDKLLDPEKYRGELKDLIGEVLK